MTSSGEGISSLPVSQMLSMGTPPAPIATTPWLENALILQTMMAVLSWTIMPQPNTGLPLE
jgi:hypothetical protein